MNKPSKQMLRVFLACSVFTGLYGADNIILPVTQAQAAALQSTAAEAASSTIIGQPDEQSKEQSTDIDHKSSKVSPEKSAPSDTVTASAQDKKQEQPQSPTAEKKAAKPDSKLPKEPITIVADELYMNDTNGDVFAKGNVKIAQATRLVVTDLVNGNTKQQEIWINGPANFSESLSKTHLDTQGLRYNYQTKEGTLDTVKGMVGREHVTGQEALTLNGEIIIHDGTITRCPAKIPDYHISADKIEIWPGEKMVAYNAKVWLGTILLYTTPTYTQSLDPNAEQTAYPSVSYSNRDGIHIKQKFTQSLDKNLSAYEELNYYGKMSFKNNGGIKWDQKDYSMEVKAGYYRDSNANWVKKLPEYDFRYKSHRIGTLPITYTFDATYGKWIDSARTSWHQEYNLYFTRDQIHLDPKTTLDMGTGVGRIMESSDDSQINNFKYDVTVGHKFDEKWYSWVGYHYTKTENSLFAFNRADMGRELDTGFTYRIDKKNAIGFSQSYDMTNKRVYDQDYTWYRDLHCWQLTLTYRAKRQEWKWDLAVTRW